jgi:hypothetical protein
MATEGIIAIKNTAPKYLKGAADQTIRNRLWLSLLREHGRIKLGDGGVSCYWNVKAREPEIRQNGDAGQQIFAEHDAYEQLTVDVRGYVGTDRLTLKKKLMNKGPLQIVDLYGTKLENLLTSLSNNFGAELYIDGNATGNENRLCGVNSCTGDDGNTVAADILANPSDTYGGKSTALGNLGGTWTANLTTKPNATAAKDWPYGSGSSEYDYISPKLINYSSTSWPSGGTTWRENCSVVMRRARTWCKATGGGDNIPMLHLLSSSLYDEFEDYQETKFRTIIPHKSAEDLGFPDALNFNGAIVKHEFDCPANEGYGINLQDFLLFSIHDEFFYTFGPEWNTESLSDLMLVGFFGNMRMNPKGIAKYKNYA